jgi:3',5'-cyclic AMP phosphodiesterase CpdA
MRTIAHVSDFHFGRDDPVVADALARDVSNSKPDLLVFSGDFTQRARAGQYRRAANFRARLPVPQLLIPGNHDVPLYDVFSRVFRPLGNYRRFIGPTPPQTFLDDQIAVMALNSTRRLCLTATGFWKDGSVSKSALEEAVCWFLDVPEETTKIVVTHHPFLAPPGRKVHGTILHADRTLRALSACGVHILLGGHLHRSYCGLVAAPDDRRNMLSIQAGTALSTRLRNEPNAWNRIVVDPRVVTVEVRAWTGTYFTAAGVSRFLRTDAGGWEAAVD